MHSVPVLINVRCYSKSDANCSAQRSDPKGHVWTVPAVQEESDVLRSVRVQPCMRPVFRVEACPVAMQPLWLLALM